MIGKILLRLQEHLKRWIKPATSVLISTLSDLTRSRIDLVVENALLRQQLIVLKRQIKRPQLTNPDRFRLVFLSHFTVFWKQALHIVQPDTFCAGIVSCFDSIGGGNRKASHGYRLKRSL